MSWRIRPVYISNTSDVPKEYMDIVLESVKEVLRIAEVDLPIKNFSSFNSGTGDFESADWYIRSSWNPQRKQADTDKILKKIMFEPFRKTEQHYDVFITGVDLYNGSRKDNIFVFGTTTPYVGTIQSYHRFEKFYGKGLIPTLLDTITLHEVPHIFGIPSQGRRNVTEALGTHCTNYGCVMGQYNVQGWPDILEATRTRKFLNMTYCGDCTHELKNFFKE